MTLATVWFDFGGVLSPPITELFSIYEDKTGIAPEQLQAAMTEVARPRGLHPLAPVELALISEVQWGTELAQALHHLYPEIDLSRSRLDRFGEQWFEGVRANETMVNLLGKLKAAGHQIGILTNNVLEWERFWRAMIEVDHLVDTIVDSCKVGSRKPEARIFNIASNLLPSPRGRTVLIDDMKENCDAANKAGWKSIHFCSNEQVIRELCQWINSPITAAHESTEGYSHD